MSLPRLQVHSLNKEFLLFRNNAVQKRRFQGAKVTHGTHFSRSADGTTVSFQFRGPDDDDEDDDEFSSDARVRLLRDDDDDGSARMKNGHARGDPEAGRRVRPTPDYVARAQDLELQISSVLERIGNMI